MPRPLSAEQKRQALWREFDTEVQAQTDEMWREDQIAQLESKLVEAHFKQHHARNENRENFLTNHIDTLTGLPNKQAFEDWLEYKLGTNEGGLTVAFIDIDYFKQINDEHGHNAGDEVLQYFSKLLVHSIREDQDIVARRSGDEFYIGIDGANATRVQEIAEAILETANQIAVAQDGRLVPSFGSNTLNKLQLSMGFVHVAPGMTLNQVMDWADRVMYKAKEAGRNQFIIEGFETKQD